eukprot:g18253.t1
MFYSEPFGGSSGKRSEHVIRTTKKTREVVCVSLLWRPGGMWFFLVLAAVEAKLTLRASVATSLEATWRSLTALPLEPAHSVEPDSSLYDPLVHDYLISDDKNASNVRSLPVFTFPVGLPFNLPGRSELSLSRNTLCGIFSGVITKWDDASILASNPALQAQPPPANTPIKLLYYSGNGEGLNLIFSKYMEAIGCSTWTFGASRTWPSSLAALPNFQAVASPLDMLATVAQTPYSLGFNAFGYSLYQGILYADLENSNGEYVGPLDASAVERFPEVSTRGQPNMINRPESRAYPIIDYAYVFMRQDKAALGAAACDRQEVLGQLLKYLWTSPDARAEMYKAGAMELSEKLQEEVLQSLSKDFPCAGAALESSAANSQISMAASNGGLNVAAACLGVLTFILSMWSVTSGSSGSKINTFFALAYMLSIGLLLASFAPWSRVPDNDSVCQARFFMPIVSTTLILSLLMARLKAFEDIYQMQTASVMHTKAPQSNIMQTLALLLLLQLIFLLVWGLVDPPTSYLSSFAKVQLYGPDGAWACQSNTQGSNAWFAVQMVSYGLVVVKGMWIVCHSTIFQFEQGIQEMRYILWALYNFAVAVIFVALLLSQVMFSQYEISVVVRAAFLFCGFNFLLTLVPRVIYADGVNDGSNVARGPHSSSMFGRFKMLMHVPGRGARSTGSARMPYKSSSKFNRSKRPSVNSKASNASKGSKASKRSRRNKDSDEDDEQVEITTGKINVKPTTGTMWVAEEGNAAGASRALPPLEAREEVAVDVVQNKSPIAPPSPGPGAVTPDINTPSLNNRKLEDGAATPDQATGELGDSARGTLNASALASLDSDIVKEVDDDNMSTSSKGSEHWRIGQKHDAGAFWDCAFCKESNPLKRGKCQNCNKPRGLRVAGDAKQVDTVSNHWTCNFCKTSNLLRRNSCQNCAQPIGDAPQSKKMVLKAVRSASPNQGKLSRLEERRGSKSSQGSAPSQSSMPSQQSSEATGVTGMSAASTFNYGQSQQFDLAIKSKDGQLLKYAKEHHAAPAMEYLFTYYGAELDSWQDFANIFEKYGKANSDQALNLPSFLYDRMCRIMVEQSFDKAKQFKPTLDAEIYRDTLSNTWLSYSNGRTTKELEAWERLVLSTVTNPSFYGEFYQYFFLLRPEFKQVLNSHNKRKHSLDGWLKLMTWGIYGHKIKAQYAKRLQKSHALLRLIETDYWFHFAAFALVVVHLNPDVTMQHLKAIQKVYAGAIGQIMGTANCRVS